MESEKSKTSSIALDVEKDEFGSETRKTSPKGNEMRTDC